MDYCVNWYRLLRILRGIQDICVHWYGKLINRDIVRYTGYALLTDEDIERYVSIGMLYW